MHATSQTLDALEDLLVQIRRRPDLTERKRGTFYRKSVAWLHFHEAQGVVHADLKTDGDWTRYPASRRGEWYALLVALDRSLER